MLSEADTLQNLCLSCGFCCNGVIFANVELQAGDDADRFQALGLRLSKRLAPKTFYGKTVQRVKFAQPCSAFDGCRCTIYHERPTHCREFNCGVLEKVRAAAWSEKQAARHIRRVRKQVDRVEKLLRALGEDNASRPLGARFKKVARAAEANGVDPSAAHAFSELTLAMHDLNLSLRQFYP